MTLLVDISTECIIDITNRTNLQTLGVLVMTRCCIDDGYYCCVVDRFFFFFSNLLEFYDKGYQQMPLSFVIFLYLHVSSLHVSGLYQPIIRGIPSCCLFVTTWFM